jgi:hypothetical protein
MRLLQPSTAFNTMHTVCFAGSAPSLADELRAMLPNALQSLQQHNSWRLWQLPGTPVFTSAAAFAEHLRLHLIPAELQPQLPPWNAADADEPNAAAAAAEQAAAVGALARRLQELQDWAQQEHSRIWQLWGKATRRQRSGRWSVAALDAQLHDAQLCLLAAVFGQLAQNYPLHLQVLRLLLEPMAAFVFEKLPVRRWTCVILCYLCIT